MIDHALPYVTVFLGPFLLTLILTPIVRAFNRRIGMVDKPDARRINTMPIPRGGGVALFLGVFGFFAAYVWFSGHMTGLGRGFGYMRFTVLALAVTALGYADDKWSLPPRVKLLGQILIAFAAWFWYGVGFTDLWPWLPTGLDACLTVFWIVGAVNAFNLIDGLDGLASGLALIASLGMAGALIFANSPGETLFHFAFAGGLLGFLRYNWHPASVFLGDSGSMLIGFTLSTAALTTHAPNSFLISVGVPLLAMGVPIFDTSLAILRRSLRRILGGRDTGSSGQVMQADRDHLHHRILRSVGLSQRKAALSLYLMAASLVAVGIVALVLKTRTGGLWMIAVAVAAVVVVRDMSSVELFDAGLLLSRAARRHDAGFRRRIARLTAPLWIVTDVVLLAVVFLLITGVMGESVTRPLFFKALPLRVTCVFVALAAVHTYSTVWSRAMASNYVRLVLACCGGTVVATSALWWLDLLPSEDLALMTILFAALNGFALCSARLFRNIVRDTFYALDCRRILGRKDVSRILVYGAGLRYRAFRRELVRSTTENTRVIVGLLDDDLLLKNHRIGGIKVLGTIQDAEEAVNSTNADAVVIACDVTDSKLQVIREIFGPLRVRLSRFTLSETPIAD